MPPITSGRVSTSRSLLPFRSLRMIGEAVAAIVGLDQLVALDHGAHRAVEDQQALSAKLVVTGDAAKTNGATNRARENQVCERR
jgi:hypothetical protein